MKLLKTTALLAAFAMAPFAANAATCDVGTCDFNGADGQYLSDGVGYDITNIENDATTGDFNAVATFFNDISIDTLTTTTVLQFEDTDLATIANLFVTFYDGVAPALTFQVTDALGFGIDKTGNDVIKRVDLTGFGPIVSVEFQGTAMPVMVGKNFQLDPGILFTMAPIPVPAAGFLMLGALGGFAAVRRKKKA